MKKFLVAFYGRKEEPVEVEAESVEFVEGHPSRYVFYSRLGYAAECPNCKQCFNKLATGRVAMFNADGVLYIKEI